MVLSAYDLLSSDLDKSQRETCHSAVTSGEMAMTLLKDTLDLAAADSGKTISLNRVACSVEGLVPRTPLTTLAREKGLEFEMQLQGSLPARVVVDRDRVRQVVWNYVTNAVKYSTEGTVSVRVSKARRSQLPPGCSIDPRIPQLLIRVLDQGPGVDPVHQHVLFSRFMQASSDLSSPSLTGNGVGLGLSIVKELTKAWGGQCGFHNRSHRGSCFWVTVPFGLESDLGDLSSDETPERSLSAEDSSSELELAHIDQSPSKEIVLVVDDNAMNVRLLSRLTTRLLPGSKIIEASDGAKAIALFEQHPDITLIMMDRAMPGEFGWCCRQPRHPPPPMLVFQFLTLAFD
jgi:Histidine kinase-, DNA gyrase B-, and HSP90-like ATPase